MPETTDRLTAALSDRYQIEHDLGQGGMATVYVAQDLKHDRKVALKVLRPELAAVIGAERFLAKIKTTANLRQMSQDESLQVDGRNSADDFTGGCMRSMVRFRSAALTVVALGVGIGCSGSGDAPGDGETPAATLSAGTVVVAGVGFATPESVLHDAVADVYLVSNINGQPLDEDGNGFISRVSPDGEVEALKWIDGEADGVTLNAPKGMAIVGDILYVSDISVVRLFDRETGEPQGEWSVDGAGFLNDIAPASDGGIYVTDTGIRMGANGFEPSGTGAVYHITPAGEVHTLATDPGLGGPNGVVEVDGEVWVVTFGSGELYRVGDGGRMDGLPVAGGLDGIVLAGGQLLVSSWGGRAVYRGPATGPFEPVVTDVLSPADIGFDASRNLVLIPMFQSDEVRFVPAG